MRYRFITAEKALYPVTLLCRLLQVSRSGYYAWCRRKESRRAAANRVLLAQIRRIHQQTQQRYGSPRMHKALLAQGMRVGLHRVARLMQQAGLRARRRRRYRVTTDSTHDRPVAPNVLQRDFQADQPNKKWAADLTYIPTQEGWLYLAVIVDLYGRRVVGWAMSDRLKDDLTRQALAMAIQQRQPPRGLIHHSDRGRQYASAAYRRQLTRQGIRPSMSRVGNCWDNAVVESFFATLKTELIHHHAFRTRAQARLAIFEYIEGFYNTHRFHSALGYLSPAEFERRGVA